MRKERNRFIKNLRYFFLISIITIGLMTIVGTGGGGGGSSPPNIPPNNGPSESDSLYFITIGDNEGNSYTITGAEQSVTGLNVTADDEKNPEDILAPSEEALTEGFVKLDFPDSAELDLLCEVRIKYDRVPTMIIAYDEEDDEYYTLPFSVTDDNTVILDVVSKDMSVLSAYDESIASLNSKSIRRGSSTAYEKRFEIVINNGEWLKVKTDMVAADNWELEINGEKKESDVVPLDGVIYNNHVSQSGIYTFYLYNTVLRVLSLRIWKQDVFVQLDDDLDGINIQSIAEKYAPILAYNDDEEYYPVSLKYIFDKDINEKIPFLIPTVSYELFYDLPYSNVDTFMPYNGAADAYIRYRNKLLTSKQKDRKGDSNTATVYYSMLKGKAGNYYLSYNLFYTYDPKGGTSSNPGAFAHVFDRESIVVVFDGKPDTSNEPVGIIYGAHLEGQNLALMSSEKEQYNYWEGSGAFVPWNNVYTHNGKPIAAVAKGSHAFYPVCGTYANTFYVFLEPAGGNATFSSEAEWKRVLTSNQYTLESLDIGNITSNGSTNYLAFSGSWVNILRKPTANFPPFTEREKDPDAWYAGAYVWAIDHSGLPNYSIQLMQSLMDYLQSIVFDDFSTDTTANYVAYFWPQPKINVGPNSVKINYDSPNRRAILKATGGYGRALMKRKDNSLIAADRDFEFSINFETLDEYCSAIYLGEISDYWQNTHLVFRTGSYIYHKLIIEVNVEGETILHDSIAIANSTNGSLRIRRVNGVYSFYLNDELIWEKTLDELSGLALYYGAFIAITSGPSGYTAESAFDNWDFKPL